MPETPPPPPATDRRDRRSALAWVGAATLVAAFGSGYLPAVRDVRMLDEAEDALRAEIRVLRGVTERLRREIDAARHDPLYAEALRRAQGGGRLPGEPVSPAGWRVPVAGASRP